MIGDELVILPTLRTLDEKRKKISGLKNIWERFISKHSDNDSECSDPVYVMNRLVFLVPLSSRLVNESQ
jgi:hypothetical protein